MYLPSLVSYLPTKYNLVPQWQSDFGVARETYENRETSAVTRTTLTLSFTFIVKFRGLPESGLGFPENSKNEARDGSRLSSWYESWA